MQDANRELRVNQAVRNLNRSDARRTVSPPDQPTGRRRHDWQMLALGRVCLLCQTAQATDEFDDGVPCEAC